MRDIDDNKAKANVKTYRNSGGF